MTALQPTLTRRLLDVLLTTEPAQSTRLAQAGLSMLVMAAGVAGMHYFVYAGVAPARPVTWWTLVCVAFLVGTFTLIRSGWSRRFEDASLVVPQMVCSITLAAWAYTLLGSARGAVFPIQMVILMFGLFAATPRQMAWISVYAVFIFGLVMLVMASIAPATYPPALELGHFIIVATMMPAVSILAARLSQIRHRLRMQRVELKHALARIEELATRDPLTGLVNRRHMQELVERERQRSVRSGHVFCLAMFDIDRFKAVNERFGLGAGDEFLRLFAREALVAVRVSDRLGRWGGESFLLMLTDARATLARGGVERLRERVAAIVMPAGAEAVRITVSAGLTEHHAGESAQAAIDRAQAALRDAKQQGRDRVVVA